MAKRRKSLRLVVGKTLGYPIAWLFGLTVGLVFWILVLSGRIVTRGYWNLYREVRRGRLIIVSNHESMLETLLVHYLLLPWALVRPDPFFIWMVPDRRLLPRRFRWLFACVRCITVDRTDERHSKAGAHAVIDVLKEGGVVVIYPQEGRDEGKLQRDRGLPYVKEGRRRMRQIISEGVIRLARGAGARILPMWVETREVLPPGRIVPDFLRGPVRFSATLPSCNPAGLTLHRLQRLILTA